MKISFADFRQIEGLLRSIYSKTYHIHALQLYGQGEIICVEGMLSYGINGRKFSFEISYPFPLLLNPDAAFLLLLAEEMHAIHRHLSKGVG